MFLIVICMILLFILGFREKLINEKNIKTIPIRVNINGIRGKSTATRLITGILIECGYKTIGKTTGTAARMIYWNRDDEKKIVRGIQGANIKEQIKVIAEAALVGADALVCECMAVTPEYQEVYQEQMIKANICVIVNVLKDHMDVMGPTLDQVAQAFSKTIPSNGYLITVNSPYRKYFEEIAKKKNTKVIIADNSKIPNGYLDKFDYILFPENISIALAVAEALNIDRKIALKGILNAHPDPGAMRIYSLINDDIVSTFINGFAANEPESTISIWNKVCEKNLPTDNPIILFNGRLDRVDRTEQFVKEMFPILNGGTLIGIGKGIKCINDAYEKGKFNIDEYIDLSKNSTEDIMEVLIKIMNNRVIFGIGNIHGDSEPLIKELLKLEQKKR